MPCNGTPNSDAISDVVQDRFGCGIKQLVKNNIPVYGVTTGFNQAAKTQLDVAGRDRQAQRKPFASAVLFGDPLPNRVVRAIVLSKLTTFVEGRELDDDASLLLRWSDGARGTLIASQIAYGEENGLTLRVYGTEGSIAWRQEEPETLMLKIDDITTISRRGTADLSEMAQRYSRLPPGHPEGFIEGFAYLYQNAVRTIEAQKAGDHPSTADLDFPTVWDGARGVHLVERALESTRLGGWVDARYTPPQEPSQ